MRERISGTVLLENPCEITVYMYLPCMISCTATYCYLLPYIVLLLYRNITLVISDSRGVPVTRRIDDPNVICRAVRGARLQDMIGIADSMIATHQPKTCLILAGVNNITLRDRRTRRVSLMYYDPFELANFIIRLINRVRSRLISNHPQVRFGIGGIIGINLNHYNGLEGFSPYQWVVDDAIRQINAYVRLLNQQARLYHPRLTTKVHTYYRGRPKNQYRLLPDGLHLGEILVNSWARNIVRFHLVNTVGLAPLWSNEGNIDESDNCNHASVING